MEISRDIENIDKNIEDLENLLKSANREHSKEILKNEIKSLTMKRLVV